MAFAEFTVQQQVYMQAVGNYSGYRQLDGEWLTFSVNFTIYIVEIYSTRITRDVQILALSASFVSQRCHCSKDGGPQD
jgi:hypothetical protein